MVLGYHGCIVPLAELRAACSVSRDGTSALDIRDAAKRYGLEVDPLQADVDDLDEVELPAIVFWEFNHFLVLERLGRSTVQLVDPAIGRRTISRDAFARSYTGVALELQPGPDFRTRARASRSVGLYRTLLRGAAPGIVVMLLSACLLEALGLLFPTATAFTVDYVVRPRQTQWLAVLGAAFTSAILLRAVISLARDRILGGLESKLNVRLAASLVKHILMLPTAFFSQRGAGDLLSRIGALLAARERFARLLVSVFDVLLVGAYIALMLLYDVALGGIIVGLQSMMVLITALGRRGARIASMARQNAASKAQSALVQAFSDPEIAKAFGAEALLLARYASARSQELNAHAEGHTALERGKQALSLLDGASAALVLWVGGSAVLDHRMTLGVLASFLGLQALVGPPLLRLVTTFQDAADIGPMIDRIDDVFESAAEPTGRYVPRRIEGAISFERVSFRYGPKGPLILDEVSFEVAAGERVAIAGVSGAGKSTILKLVLGLIQPTSGTVRIDQRDVRDYDIDALRASVGTVLANGTFFDDTVYDNVALGAPDATPGDVRAALQAACIADVIDALPDGPLTRLRTGAKQLSGGQRQRLLLARALVKRPSMLLLDEASSALDGELERRIQAYLSRMRCTMLIIAHRPSAVAMADRILFLEKGHIVQDGSYEELAARPGPFRELFVVAMGSAT